MLIMRENQYFFPIEQENASPLQRLHHQLAKVVYDRIYFFLQKHRF